MSNYRKLLLVFFRQSPVGWLGAVSCSMAYRVTSTLALLLPLKIILMLSHDRVPAYFPEFLITFEFEKLIFLLSGIAVVLYAVGQSFWYWYASIKSRLLRSFIVTWLEADPEQHQERRVNKVYEKALDATGELLFVILVMLFVTLVFPMLVVSVIGFSVLAILFFKGRMAREEPPVEFCSKDSEPKRSSRQSIKKGRIVKETLNPTIKRVTDIGYLVIFLVIVGGYAFEVLPNLILVFVSFIALNRSLSALRLFILKVFDLAQLDQAEMHYLLKAKNA